MRKSKGFLLIKIDLIYFADAVLSCGDRIYSSPKLFVNNEIPDFSKKSGI
ncbi:MAG: hypothetical protein KAF91_24835 [Nostoc sp. TH1S01]|nr:hypothetical protein [Nostoc sp. TH1S01]